LDFDFRPLGPRARCRPRERCTRKRGPRKRSPASAAPESAAPESAAPESAAPAAPESAAPASAAPDSGAPAGAPASGAPASAGTGDAQELGLQIEELTTEVARFAEESAEYRADGTRLIEHKYERRKREIKQRYNKVVEELQLEERRRRGDAISRFEEFLQRYPDNPRYTPDAMFRLAELHFERANDVYVTALERYDSEISAFDAGKSEVEPEEPTQDYGRTIDLFGELIRRWPRYRNIDGAYYLRGYCLLEMGKDEEALDQFRILVRTFPKSRFVPETWTRIGEYHFDKNELNEAISAYEKVLAFPDSTYFDKALYKLGWTHYLADQYDPAIKRFRQLIEFSDARVERTGEAGSDLRAEAIEYLAISISDEDWDGDGLPDADSGIPRVRTYVRGEKPYDVELLRALADRFHVDARYPEAVATMRQLLEQFPLDPQNPDLHAKLIVSLERQQQLDEAFKERDRLGRAYGPESDWYAANENNPKAIEAARELLEESLIQAAQYHHSRAQQLKARAAGGDGLAERQAIDEYRLAAESYEDYLQQYPKSENAYDLGYFLAECLYYSFRFPEASDQYGKVRDDKRSSRYTEAAAFSAVLARENHVGQLIEKGEVPRKPSLTGQPDATPAPAPKAEGEPEGAERIEVEVEDLPEAVERLIEVRIKYVDRQLKNAEDPERQPRMIYKIGETFFDFRNFDESRKWFQKLIAQHPNSQVAGFAAGKVMETFRLENDFDGMAQWAQFVKGANLKGDIASSLGEIGVGAEFMQASILFRAKKFDQAAAKYEELIGKHPGNKTVDAAINNLAVAYEATRRFESATKAYERLYTEKPKSPFAENALFRVGVNSERFYNYDKAIQSHLRLVDSYPESENRATSLFSAAVLLEQTQQYRQAAAAYERYADLFPEREDTPVTFFRAGQVYQKLGDTQNQLRIYREFNKRHGGDPRFNAQVVEGLARTAEVVARQGNPAAARKAWSQVIDEFNRRGMAPGSYEARYPAEAQFRIIEQGFETYAAQKLKGSLRQQGKVVQAMQAQVKDLSRRYGDVLQYKSLDWTLATFYRLGHLYQLFAEKLYEAPVPEGLSADDEDLYRTELEDVAVPLEDEAVKRYETAYQKAREFRLTNEWTKRIVAALNKYKPSDYPLFKEERRMSMEELVSPPHFLVPPGGAPEEPEEAPEAGAEGAAVDEAEEEEDYEEGGE
jgi:TolA-binding protein